ncbi:Yip1 family protein [Mesobacillus zeae]|uniref:YIP1 family protein n=1 Tax=Mesobacillus zeae TaxID=1917180 RepID=A0A398AZL1_9BACI|nr:Yip1 family protein [Mesobacillus zeae]RID83099.1 YIP1 family protein [Mesobacillus zeae]
METQTETKIVHAKPSLLGMYTSPGDQFERIRVNPRIWMPLAIVTILSVIGSALIAMGMDASFFIEMGTPKDQAETVVGFTKIVTVITGFLTPIFTVLISSAIYLAIAKIAGSEVKFKQLFSMNSHIMIISITGLILNGIVNLAIGGNPEVLVTSLAGLLNQEKTGALSAIELFSIWNLILVAIGLQKVGRLSKGLSWTVAIIFFLISVGFSALNGLISSVQL